MKLKHIGPRAPGEPDEPPPQYGASEWKRARYAEREGFRRLKEATELTTLVGAPTTEQSRAIRKLRMEAFLALAKSKNLRFAAYLEGYMPRQTNRGVRYDPETGMPVEGSKGEFERWWARLDAETQGQVERRRANYIEMCEREGYKAVWKLRPPRRRAKAKVFQAPGWNLGPA